MAECENCVWASFNMDAIPNISKGSTISRGIIKLVSTITEIDGLAVTKHNIIWLNFVT